MNSFPIPSIHPPGGSSSNSNQRIRTSHIEVKAIKGDLPPSLSIMLMKPGQSEEDLRTSAMARLVAAGFVLIREHLTPWNHHRIVWTVLPAATAKLAACLQIPDRADPRN